MTEAFKGFAFNKGDGAGPDVYTPVGEVKSVSGIGATNAMISVTNADSGNSVEVIPGMSDGAEITVECNYLPGNANQSAIKAHVDAGESGNVQLVLDDGTVVVTLTFNVAYLSWNINPSFDDANTISFTMKISGNVTEVQA